MQRPTEGITAKVRLWHGQRHDGDTVPLELPILGNCKVRLIDCWTPEMREPGGPEAAEYLRRLLVAADADGLLYAWLPPFVDTDGDGRISLLEMIKQGTSFERLPGRLWIESGSISHDVSELMVEAGFATREDTKRKRRHDQWGRVI